jgi:hypothetical protein
MKSYVFGIGLSLMLLSSLTGTTYIAAVALRRIGQRFVPLSAIAVGTAALFALVAALVWSVPVQEAL